MSSGPACSIIQWYQIIFQTFEAKGYEHMSVATHTVSFWTWVAMVNAVGRNFYNDLFDPDVYPE